MYKPLKRFILYALTVASAAYLSVIPTIGSDIKITKPTEKEILYGPTKIDVSVPDVLKKNISRIDFYLDQYPGPICRDFEYPYECGFNAGTDYLGRGIKAEAYDKNGKLLDVDNIRTRAFIKPVQVKRYRLEVPVRVKNDSKLELSENDFQCLFGYDECKVASVKKLSESKEMTKTNTYLDVHMDISGSMSVSREEMGKALDYVIDNASKNTKIRLSTFSEYGTLDILTDFTSDKNKIKSAIEKIGPNEGKTCLFYNTEKLMELSPYNGFRRILLITDCMDTCDDIDIVETIFKLSRESGIVIDVLRTKGRFKEEYVAKVCEGLATETSGNIFKGDITDFISVMEKIVSEVNETYVIDIDLPDNLEEGTERRLQIKPKVKNISVDYPDYWSVGLSDSISLRMLGSKDAIIRYNAIERFVKSDNPKIIEDLIKAYESESNPSLKEKEITTIYNLIGSNLLHKEDPISQNLAISSIEDLDKIDRILTKPLESFLEVYTKKENISDRLKNKANNLLAKKNIN